MHIAWIGLGVMGEPMAGHLLAAGHEVVVHTRTRGKADALLARGAHWADDPAAAAEGRDVVFSMVGFPAEVEEVHLGPRGTLEARNAPKIVCDLSTSEPALAARIAAAARARGAEAVDAPVSGGDVGARNKSLSIMVGATSDAFEVLRPLLGTFGRKVVLQGPPGAGQHAKLVNQILIASNMIGVCEALLYARRAGLDPLAVLESVASGAAGSWSLDHLAPRMLQRDFAPGFLVVHFLKDLRIALAEAARMKLALPGLALAAQLFAAVEAQGHGRRGTQALLLALETLNGEEPARG